MRNLKPVFLFSFSFVLSLAACAVGANDSFDNPETAASTRAVNEDVEKDNYSDLLISTEAASSANDEVSPQATCPPGGSWWDSCWNERCYGSQLCATCRTRSGGTRRSCVDVGPCGSVNNCNGQLSCSPSC